MSRTDEDGLDEWLRGNAAGRDACHRKAHADLDAAVAEAARLRDALRRVGTVVGEAEGSLRSDCWGDLVDDLRTALSDAGEGLP